MPKVNVIVMLTRKNVSPVVRRKTLKASKIHTINEKVGLSRINIGAPFPYDYGLVDRSADFHPQQPSRKI